MRQPWATIINQSPIGIIWSAVPLPRCKHSLGWNWAVAGQQPRYETKSCKIGTFSIYLSVRPSIHPYVRPPPWNLKSQAAKPQSQPARTQSQPAKPHSQPARTQSQPARPHSHPAKPHSQPASSQIQPARHLHSTGLRPVSGPLPKNCNSCLKSPS